MRRLSFPIGQWLSKSRARRAGANENCRNCRRQDELLAILAPIGSLRVDRVPLPGTDVTLRITRTANKRLISDAERARNKWRRSYRRVLASGKKKHQIPHWAEIWPSGVVLAGMAARQREFFAGKRVLELGPGVGATAVAAMQAGANVVVADAGRGSLALCALNALNLVGSEPEAILVDWLEPNQEFLDAASDGFSIILAADVLDEMRYIKPLLELVDRYLAPDGEFWLAHPERAAAVRLAQEFRALGWRDEQEKVVSSWPDPLDHTWDEVTVHRFRRPAASTR